MTSRDRDQGFTLIELLVAITLMAIAFGAVFGGLGLYFRIQATQRVNATIDAEIRNYADRILALPYVDCATPTSYAGATTPAGLTSTIAVTYWDGSLPATFGSTCTSDRGFQRITISMTGSDGGAGNLQIGKSR